MRTRVFGSLLLAGVLAVAPAGAETIKLASRWGKWITVTSSGAVSATAAYPGATETFTYYDSECLRIGNQISLRTSGGKYIGITGAAGDLQAVATSAGANEKFTLHALNELAVPTGVSGHGVLPRPASIALKAANGKYICGGENGILLANCTTTVDDAYFNATIDGGTWGTFAVNPVINLGSPVKKGTALTLTANPTGGVGGTSMYKFIVRNASGTIVYPAPGTQPAFTGTYSATWTPAQAGAYTVEVTMQRSCEGKGPLFEATGTKTAAVMDVNVTAPSAGQVKRQSSQTISWTTTNPPTQFKNGSLAFFVPATYSTFAIADISDVASGTYTWNVPADFPLATGVIRVTSFANANLSWDGTNNLTIIPSTEPPQLQWKWSTRLTREHIAQLNLTEGLSAAQLSNLDTQTYTIGTIINSGSTFSSTDRLYDAAKCKTCHDVGTTYKYRPAWTAAITPSTSIVRGDGSSFQWNQTGVSGIVQRFIDSAANKPEILEKLFKKWLDSGAQP
jgi:hypothetical protein